MAGKFRIPFMERLIAESQRTGEPITIIAEKWGRKGGISAGVANKARKAAENARKLAEAQKLEEARKAAAKLEEARKAAEIAAARKLAIEGPPMIQPDLFKSGSELLEPTREMMSFLFGRR